MKVLKTLLWMTLAVMLLATTFSAAAQITPPSRAPCEPNTFLTTTSKGSPVVQYWGLNGAMGVWWCPAEYNPDGTVKSWYLYYVGGLYKYAASTTYVKEALQRIQAASEAASAPADAGWVKAQEEMAASKVSTPAGSVDACNFSELRRSACRKITAFTFGNPFPSAQPATYCGTSTDCSTVPPPVTVWRATGGYIYRVGAGGVLTTDFRKAAVNALGDCTVVHIVRVTAGTPSDLCPLAGARTDEVTQVVKKAS